MEPQPDIATVASHFSDRSRARMLLELLDGAARPVTRLAEVAGIGTSTASEHLTRLTRAGWLLLNQMVGSAGTESHARRWLSFWSR